MLFCRLLTFQNQLFLKNSFTNTIRVYNSLVPDHAKCLVEPDLGLNCLHFRLSADEINRQRVNYLRAIRVRVREAFTNIKFHI